MKSPMSFSGTARNFAANLAELSQIEGATLEDVQTLVAESWVAAEEKRRELALARAEWQAATDAYHKRVADNHFKLKAALSPAEWASYQSVYEIAGYNGEHMTRRTALFKAIGTLKAAQVLHEALGDAEATEF